MTALSLAEAQALIAELKEEVAYLRSELGLADASLAQHHFRKALGLTPVEGKLLWAFYSARHHMLRKYNFDEVVPPAMGHERDYSDTFNVWVRKLRIKLGQDVILTVWGEGYRLSPRGVQLVQSVLAAND
jgi:DNA-binding response OmpR family regulator